MIGQGAIIGVVAVIVDEVLKRDRARLHLPPLAIGMGIYLPLEADLLIPFGALLGWFYNRWAMTARSPAFAERMGVLMATGLIVGESLMGVVYAFAVAGAEKAGRGQRERLRADCALFVGHPGQFARLLGGDRRALPLDQGPLVRCSGAERRRPGTGSHLPAKGSHQSSTLMSSR